MMGPRSRTRTTTRRTATQLQRTCRSLRRRLPDHSPTKLDRTRRHPPVRSPVRRIEMLATQIAAPGSALPDPHPKAAAPGPRKRDEHRCRISPTLRRICTWTRSGARPRPVGAQQSCGSATHACVCVPARVLARVASHSRETIRGDMRVGSSRTHSARLSDIAPLRPPRRIPKHLLPTKRIRYRCFPRQPHTPLADRSHYGPSLVVSIPRGRLTPYSAPAAVHCRRRYT